MTTARLVTLGVVLALIPALASAPAQATPASANFAPDALYAENFDAGLTGWSAVAGSITDWTVANGTAGIDTRSWGSGRYIRPTAPVGLPDAYELRTTVKIDEIAAGGTITLMLDMLQPDSLKASGISPQFTGFNADGRAGVQVAKPIASGTMCKGLSPVSRGKWFDLTVRRAGGVTAVYADDQLVASVPSAAAGGTIGIGSYKSKVSFGVVTVDALPAVPADHPAATGCAWTAPSGPGEVSGSGEWVDAVATTSDRPGHEVTAGEASISLDGDWRFTTDPSRDGESRNLEESATDRSTWDVQQVPGNWDVHDKYATYSGQAWYARTFETGDLSVSAGQRAALRFGAVYWTADVWLNGVKLGTHEGGYTPFEFDVTDLLVNGINTLVVRADNTFEQGAWWARGGISRSVALVRTGEVTIDRQQIVATPSFPSEDAVVNSTVFVDNAGSVERTVQLQGRITDAATGQTIVDGLSASVAVPGGGSASTVLSAQLTADQYRLWNLNDPALYRLEVTLDAPGRMIDSAVSDRFGIRLFAINGTKITLNGAALKLAGANRVSDDPINGNVEPVDVVRRDMDRMKASGLNLNRIMHYAQAPELLDYADEIGMILIDEVPVWGTDRKDQMINNIGKIKTEFREMVERDFNHASVFAHSVANEIESREPYGQTYVKAMYDFSEEIDPTRFVTFASNKVQNSANGMTDTAAGEASQYSDFVSVNLYGNFSNTQTNVNNIHGTYPTKPIYITEYSPDSFNFGVDRETLDSSVGSVNLTSIFESRDYIAGWSQWSYNDYRSEYVKTSPNDVRGWGQQDVWGRLKAGYPITQADNAPLAGLTIDKVGTSPDGGAGVITVTPRAANLVAGPAYTLAGYRVTVQATAPNGTIVGGALVDLPVLATGAAPVVLPVTWATSAQASRLRVTLLSPTGFEEAVSVSSVAPAAAPEIVDTVVANQAVRVRFSDPAGAGPYTVVAADPSGDVSIVTTAEMFADLKGLTNGTEYTIRVSAARSPLTDTVTATPTGTAGMAPKLFTLSPIQNGLVLGFSQNSTKVPFEVNVQNAATGADVRTYETMIRPGTRIEGLTAGTQYRVRIRETSAAAPSVWSEALVGTPLSATSAPSLRVLGTIPGSSAGAVVISPTDNTIRYRVTVSGPGVQRSTDVERSWVNLLPIDGLAPDATYAVTVAAVGAGGTSSLWAGTMTTTPAPTGAVAQTPTGMVLQGSGAAQRLTWNTNGADAYLIARTACGSTTYVRSVSNEAIVGSQPGQYTVAAILPNSVSSPTPVVAVAGDQRCGTTVATNQTAARADGSTPFSTTGAWSNSSLKAPGGYGSRYSEIKTIPASTPPPTATWTAPLGATAARYRIEVAVPVSSTSSRQVSYSVASAGGATQRLIDQVADGGRWASLGEFDVDASSRATVVLTGGAAGFLRASAVRFIPVD